MPTPRIPIDNQFATYFLTITNIEWINIYTKSYYFECLAKNFNYCIKQKGLVLYEYVFMTNHLHFIARAQEGSEGLSTILQQLKSYLTTQGLRKLVDQDKRTYIKTLLSNSYSTKEGSGFQILQRENYPEEITSDDFRNQKIQYIWDNPVKEQYVFNPEDWCYSSARQKLLNLPADHPEVKVPCMFWEDEG